MKRERTIDVDGLKIETLEGIDFSRLFREAFGHPENLNTKEIKPEVRAFPSGAVRSSDKGRPKPAYFSPYALEAVGLHLANNENDFGATNFWLGIPEEECVQSMMRHYCDYGKAVFTKNEEKQYQEAVAMLFNAHALVHTMCIKREGSYTERLTK